MIGIAGGVAGVFLVAAGSKPAAAKKPAGSSSGALPFSIPGVTPVQVESRDTSLTGFPIDEWDFPALPGQLQPVLVIASDDPTSFVAFGKALPGALGPVTVLSKGVGPLTAQIAAKL